MFIILSKMRLLHIAQPSINIVSEKKLNRYKIFVRMYVIRDYIKRNML